jgi:hypothetical protein
VRNVETGKDEETLLELNKDELAALISRLRHLHSVISFVSFACGGVVVKWIVVKVFGDVLSEMCRCI